MKKVVTVHLANRVFQMEEDAYACLQEVLATQWEKSELEKRVAEHLERSHAGQEKVVTYQEVTDALRQLGIVPPAGHFTGMNRKLYRQSLNKVFGGVCSGLGEYLDVDPVAIRVLFLVGFFFGTLGFWLYLVLWIAVPLAPVRL